MALYSFCVRKKGTNNYIRANMRHELSFLDFFAMKFNNKRELMQFLGADLNKYDDIAITYQNNHEAKFLPIYFDAIHLDQITSAMINLDAIDNYESIYEALAVAYKNPSVLKIKEVPIIKTVDEIVGRIAYENRPTLAFRNNRMNQKALEYYENGRNEMFRVELMKSYLNIRKAYMSLRENGQITSKKVLKKVPNVTMQTIYDNYQNRMTNIFKYQKAYETFKLIKTTPYEDVLIQRIIEGDDDAYDELMQTDLERIEKLKPILDFIKSLRGNAKKIGTID